MGRGERGVSLVDTFVETEMRHWRGLLAEAYDFARRSPDPSSQNAAVLCYNNLPIELTWSVNEFPRGVEYLDERWERPLKYSVIEHAERNAIFSAAFHGIPCQELTMVCPWAACSDCARAIIQAGIPRLVTHRPEGADPHANWNESIDIAMTMLAESGVEVIYIDGPLGLDFTILRNGVPFTP